MIDIDFREWLAGLDLIEDTDIPGSIQQESIDQNGPTDYVWFHRRSSTQAVNLDGSKVGFVETSYDVELCSGDINTAQAMADDLKAELNGFRGTMDDSFINGAFVEDHNDEYQQANGQDGGIFVCSLDVTIIHTDIP